MKLYYTVENELEDDIFLGNKIVELYAIENNEPKSIIQFNSD